jgi:hypothetical protein
MKGGTIARKLKGIFSGTSQWQLKEQQQLVADD